MVKFSSARDNAQSKVQDFLQALHVVLGAVSIDGKSVSDVREDQGIDQGGEKFRWDLMAHVGQSDEDTVALFDEGGYMCDITVPDQRRATEPPRHCCSEQRHSLPDGRSATPRGALAHWWPHLSRDRQSM